MSGYTVLQWKTLYIVTLWTCSLHLKRTDCNVLTEACLAVWILEEGQKERIAYKGKYKRGGITGQNSLLMLEINLVLSKWTLKNNMYISTGVLMESKIESLRKKLAFWLWN